MAATYNLIAEYSDDPKADDINTSPHWVLAVARLAKPLSYSRADKASVTRDPTEGAKLRGGKLLVITSDCVQLAVQASKESHLSTMTATLLPGGANYLVEVLPGDWILAWIVHGEDRQRDLVRRIRSGKACNGFDDGLKFVGRVETVSKTGSFDRGSGRHTTRYQLSCYGFRELDTQVFYDHFLASNSVESQDLGRWLAKVGLDIQELFGLDLDGMKDNVHLLIPAFMELLVGRGVSQSINSTSETALQAFTGGGAAGFASGALAGAGDQIDSKEAPFAYLVPKEVGDLLGKSSRDASKAGGILAYADLCELLFGVQKYSGSGSNTPQAFVPDIAFGSPLTKGNQKFTGTEMMGAFLPQMPDFDNRPLWTVLGQFLNPTINEMYTALRVNDQGSVVPTVVLRQIPFTSPVLAKKIDEGQANVNGRPIPYTGFYDLPRWVLPRVMVDNYQIARSDALRCNFVHVYGQAANEAVNIEQTDQIVNNPPVRDDFDIQRSGLHTYMTTVACRAINEVGTNPGAWIELIADHRIGAQWTVSGTVTGAGIQAPIPPGDNLEFNGIVFHIEAVQHVCSCDPGGGRRTWMTSLTLSNGLRSLDGIPPSDTGAYPIYPGFEPDDDEEFDPGLTVEDDGANDEPEPNASSTTKGSMDPDNQD